MATMNVPLTESMKDWVESQARTGRYSDAADYVRDLIRRDQENSTIVRELQHCVTQGLESGIGTQSMDDLLKAARQQANMEDHAV